MAQKISGKQKDSFIYLYGTQCLSILLKILSTGTYTHNMMSTNNLNQLEGGGYIESIGDRGDGEKYKTTEKARVLISHIYDALLNVGEPQPKPVEVVFERNNIK